MVDTTLAKWIHAAAQRSTEPAPTPTNSSGAPLPYVFDVDDPTWTSVYLFGPVGRAFGAFIHRDRHISRNSILTVAGGHGPPCSVDVCESLKRASLDLERLQRGARTPHHSREAAVQYFDFLLWLEAFLHFLLWNGFPAFLSTQLVSDLYEHHTTTFRPPAGAVDVDKLRENDLHERRRAHQPAPPGAHVPPGITVALLASDWIDPRASAAGANARGVLDGQRGLLFPSCFPTATTGSSSGSARAKTATKPARKKPENTAKRALMGSSRNGSDPAPASPSTSSAASISVTAAGSARKRKAPPSPEKSTSSAPVAKRRRSSPSVAESSDAIASPLNSMSRSLPMGRLPSPSPPELSLSVSVAPGVRRPSSNSMSSITAAAPLPVPTANADPVPPTAPLVSNGEMRDKSDAAASISISPVVNTTPRPSTPTSIRADAAPSATINPQNIREMTTLSAGVRAPSPSTVDVSRDSGVVTAHDPATPVKPVKENLASASENAQSGIDGIDGDDIFQNWNPRLQQSRYEAAPPVLTSKYAETNHLLPAKEQEKAAEEACASRAAISSTDMFDPEGLIQPVQRERTADMDVEVGKESDGDGHAIPPVPILVPTSESDFAQRAETETDGSEMEVAAEINGAAPTHSPSPPSTPILDSYVSLPAVAATDSQVGTGTNPDATHAHTPQPVPPASNNNFPPATQTKYLPTDDLMQPIENKLRIVSLDADTELRAISDAAIPDVQTPAQVDVTMPSPPPAVPIVEIARSSSYTSDPFAPPNTSTHESPHHASSSRYSDPTVPPEQHLMALASVPRRSPIPSARPSGFTNNGNSLNPGSLTQKGKEKATLATKTKAKSHLGAAHKPRRKSSPSARVRGQEALLRAADVHTAPGAPHVLGSHLLMSFALGPVRAFGEKTIAEDVEALTEWFHAGDGEGVEDFVWYLEEVLRRAEAALGASDSDSSGQEGESALGLVLERVVDAPRAFGDGTVGADGEAVRAFLAQQSEPGISKFPLYIRKVLGQVREGL